MSANQDDSPTNGLDEARENSGGAPGVLALIPARAGSKGLSRKNLALVGGRSLLARALDSANAAQWTMVSSDDQEILGIAAAAGALWVERPAALATDVAPMVEVVLHALSHAAGLGLRVDSVLLLQPTSPLRTTKTVSEALEMFAERRDAEALISVCAPTQSPYKAFRVDDHGYLLGLIDDQAPFRNRQELPTVWYPNGAIYIWRSEHLLASRSLHCARTVPFIMTSEESIDIDSADDLRRAEQSLSGATRPGDDRL